MNEYMDLSGPTKTPVNRSFLYKFFYYILKGVRFLWRYRKNPLYATVYILNVWRPQYHEKIKFLDDARFLNAARNRSTIRLGDGEFTLMLGTRDIFVQKSHPELRKFFFRLANEYTNESPYILALPPHLIIENSTLNKHHFHYLWMPGKILYNLYFDHDATYADASFFYHYGMTEKFLSSVSVGRHLIFVTNEQNIKLLKQKEPDLVPKANLISYIQTPSTDTFSLRDQILQEIENSIKESSDKPIVIFACGPAGKFLTMQLAQAGVVSHDVGSGIAFLFDKEDHGWQMKWEEFGDIYINKRDLINS